MSKKSPDSGINLLQVEVLSALFRAQKDAGLVLKGGWAMRARYGAARMTKDIDLSASPKVSLASVRSRIERALKAVATLGTVKDLKISTPKQTDTTQRWKVQAKLNGETIYLTIEVSRRDEIDPDHLVDVLIEREGRAAVSAKSYSPEMLAAAKISCLLDSKREAPRDVFDLYTLFDNNAAPRPEDLEKLSKLPNFNFDFVQAKLEALTWDRAVTELVPFLDPTAKFDEYDWHQMKEAVSDKLEEVIELHNNPVSVSAGPK